MLPPDLNFAFEMEKRQMNEEWQDFLEIIGDLRDEKRWFQKCWRDALEREVQEKQAGDKKDE